MVGYCHAVDGREWDAQDAIFTLDMLIDYSKMMGVSAGWPRSSASSRKA